MTQSLIYSFSSHSTKAQYPKIAQVLLVQQTKAAKKNPKHILSYLLCYLAVGCCNKPSCVVYITPHHIVGEV